MQACESAYSSWKFSGGFRTWVKMSLVKTKEEDGREAVEFRQEVVVVSLTYMMTSTLGSVVEGDFEGKGRRMRISLVALVEASRAKSSPAACLFPTNPSLCL